MTKRRFMSLFAVFFALVFALSVSFFAACKGNKEEDVDEEPAAPTEPEDPGSTGNENTRSGGPLTGNEDIIGTWRGDVEIEAAAYGYGGTIESKMTVVITAEEFSLAFTPNEINIDEDLGPTISAIVSSVLTSAGIAEGKEFTMFEGEPVLADEDGYYADINGDYVKYQLPLVINDADQLCVSFSEPLDFSGWDVDIIFDAVLDRIDTTVYPREDYKIDIAGEGDSEYLTLDDGTEFVNSANLDIYTEDGIEYAVSGKASLMTKEMAAWFNGGSEEGIASENDPYVVIKVAAAEGETVSYTSENGAIEKSYTNTGEGDPDFDDGYLLIVYRLTTNEGYSTDSKEFTVTSEEGTVTYTVSLTGVMLPASVTFTTYPSTLVAGGDEGNVRTSASWSDGTSYGGSYTWTSSDESVATVAPGVITGRANVTPVSEGTAVITVILDSGDSASFTVTVEPAPQSTSFTVTRGDDAVLEPGDTTELTANVVMADGDADYPIEYTWTSSDESVATVEQVMGGILGLQPTEKATVTAVGEGTATITVTLNNGESRSYDISVSPLTVTADAAEETTMEGTVFANGSSLTVTKTTGSDGTADYAIAGVATVMSEDQLEAYNAAGTADQATVGDAFIVIKILAPAGSTVTYGTDTVTVGENGTYALFVQKIGEDNGDGVKTVTITSGDDTETFTITYSGAVISDNLLVGTWTNPSISATAMGFLSATASVELTVYEDGTYTLIISDISAYGLELGDLIEVEMTGTWYGGNGTYTLTGEGGLSVTVTMSDDGDTVNMTFDIEYSGIPISVDNQPLYRETEDSGEDD